MCALGTGVQTCALPIFSVQLEERHFPLLFPRSFDRCEGGMKVTQDSIVSVRFQHRRIMLPTADPVPRAVAVSSGHLVLHGRVDQGIVIAFDKCDPRSEEHTSELQSLMRISYAVFCLKKKKQNDLTYHLN